MKFRTCSRIIQVWFIFFLYSICASAQSTNPCGVVARLWPSAADSVVPVNTLISFTNVSTNATSVKWLYDGMYFGEFGNTMNYSVSTGIHRISLVAYNGNCSDTTTVSYFSPGIAHNVDSVLWANYGTYDLNEASTCIAATPDGGFVLGGVQYLYSSCGEAGILVKTRDKGCIDWSKKFLSPYYCNNSKVTSVLSSADGSYFVSTNDLELAKLDGNGNLLWNKRFPFNGQSPISFHTMAGDPSGSVYNVSQALDRGWTITKLDINGNIAWNKYFGLPYEGVSASGQQNYMQPSGIVWLNGKIYVAGYAYSLSNDYFSFMTRLDAATGLREWQYGYKDPAFPGAVGFVHLSLYDTLLMASSGAQGQMVTLIDPQGNLRKNIKTQFASSYSPKVSRAGADSKGHIHMMQWTEEALSLQPYYWYATNFAEIDTSLNKYGGMVVAEYYRSYFNDAAMGSDNKFGAIGTNFGFVDDGLYKSRDMCLMKIDTIVSDQYCLQNTNDYTVSEKIINKFNFQYFTDSSLGITSIDGTPFVTVDAFIQSRYNCPDFIDSCSFMDISGPVNLCNLSETYTYRLHRNKKCALAPLWKVPPGVTVVNQTDSSLKVRFSNFGVYPISATLNSCIPVKDSLIISIISKNHPLQLGADTSICAGNSLTLHAGTGFFYYKWNDGSTDSVLTVNGPGQYFVQVLDSCSNILTDTIQISLAASLPIDIGPDRTKCNNDTLHLSAPGGFLNYKWFPDYNISADTLQNVSVNPQFDTSYILIAEKSAGCFARDTIHIKVFNSPSINLGRDTSFCSGDSLILNTGTGFQTYEWNTGENTQFITAAKAGMYSVTATTTFGCKSYDTLNVVSIFSNPLVSLNHDDQLCAGTSRVLDAGNFSGYLWNNGNTERTITVSETGKYSVMVVDNNYCRGIDSVIISTILPIPIGFLPADTAICSYGNLVIRPSTIFKNYLWSDNQFTSAITIAKAGTYWLQVTDFANCVGSDTINVIQKNCMEGFYIPNAFSPNMDGLNDIYKPIIFGRLQSYQFSVFNRFGQVVFKTTDIDKGWDGNKAGSMQTMGSYVWVCTYQLNDEKAVTKKGTVFLVR